MMLHHWIGMKQVKKSVHGTMLICNWTTISNLFSYRPTDAT